MVKNSPKYAHHQTRVYQQVVAAALNFALSHGVLLLGSVVHHVPTVRPHNFLLVYMRVVLFIYTINNWAEVMITIRNFE